MAHQGIKGGGLRSLRTVAMEKGTNAKGFSDSPGYSVAGGHPIGDGLTDQHYAEAKPEVDSGGAKPIEGPAPFTIKGA